MMYFYNLTQSAFSLVALVVMYMGVKVTSSCNLSSQRIQDLLGVLNANTESNDE